eukprot:796022-Pelagomonas_calceolata.AAC.1
MEEVKIVCTRRKHDKQLLLRDASQGAPDQPKLILRGHACVKTPTICTCDACARTDHPSP